MDDLVAREFDVAELIRRVTNASGDGRISASIATRNAANVKWATGALRDFSERLRESNTQVLNGYLKLSPNAAELFYPLWAVEFSATCAQMTSLALDCLQSAIRQRPELAKFAVKQQAAALIHVLNHDRRFLARKVFILLRLCMSDDNQHLKVLANTITRRFGGGILSDAKYVKSMVSNSVPRISFLQFITHLLQSKDNDSMRFLASSSKHCLVSTVGIALSVLQETIRPSKDESESTEPSVSAWDKPVEPPEKRQKREQAHLRKTALNAARDYLEAIVAFLTSCRNNYLLRSAFEPPFIDKIVAIASVNVAKKNRKKLTQNESTRAEACECARTILLAVAEHQPRVCRPYHIARAIGDIFRDTPYGSAVASSTSAYSHGLVSDVLERIPQLSSEVLRCGPFLTCQPSPSSAWLTNATVILTCTRYLQVPSDSFKKYSFFERTLNHNSPLVKQIALLVLHKLCMVKNVTADDLPVFALFMKTISSYKTWNESVHTIFATYRKLQPKLFLESKTDPIQLAVDKSNSMALAQPTIRVCLETSKQETLDAIFKKKVLSDLILTENTSPLIHDIIIATELFPQNTRGEIDVWISILKKRSHADCVPGFETLVANSWRQPFALFDETYQRNVSLLSVAAARKISKYVSASAADGMKKSNGMPKFESYLVDVLTSLAACDTIMGRKTKHSTKSLLSSTNNNKKLLNPILANSTEGSVEEAVEFLRTGTNTSVLSEVEAVGTFLAELYQFRKVNKKNSDDEDKMVLDRIWNSFCTSSTSSRTSTCKFGEEFFSFHAGQLGVSNGGGSYGEKTIFGFLYLLCAENISQCRAIPQLPREERAVMTRLNLGRTTGDGINSLQLVVDALECIEQNLLVLPLFGGSVRTAIKTSRNDNNNDEMASRIFKLVFSITKKTLKKAQNMRECAGFALGIFDAFLSHECDRMRAIFAKVIASMRGDKKNSANLARLASHAVRPYVRVLEKDPLLVEGAAKFVADMVEQKAIYESPGRFIPLLVFLASRNEAIGANVAKISLHHPWKNDENENENRTLTEAAFALGVSIGTRLKTIDNIIDTLIDVGPPDEKDSAVIWWVIACGIMSIRTAPTSTVEYAEKARNMIQMTASQISASEDDTNIYHGPVEFLRCILPHARLPNGTVQRGSADFVFADNLCTFFMALFKSTAPQLLLTIDAAADDNDNSIDITDNCNAGKERRALDELAIVLQCVNYAVSIPELGLNLARFVLSTFGEYLHVFLSVGSHANGNRNDNRKSAEGVLSIFMDIVVKATTILRSIGMDSRSAMALTKLEQLFSNPDFTFFASVSQFDAKVIKAMRNIKHAMQKDDFRRYKGLPDYRGGLFAPLAANVLPQLEAERLFATAKYVLRTKGDFPADNGSRIFPAVENGDVEPMPYDPVFALKTLRLACEYAVYTKEATLVDFNLVVNGGLLRVALAAIACDDEDIRVQAYAALDALSRALGPEFIPNITTNTNNTNNIGNGTNPMERGFMKPKQSEVPPGPATLYVNRRPLAFVLQVLKDSINNPVQQVLPLFSAWLWHVVRVLLKPSHRAHVPVMRYLLRLPRFDINDCTGVVHLLRSSDSGTDTKSLRMLALDTIEDGICSKQDHLVAKKRNLYTSILLLAGSSMGMDTAIRDKAVKVLGHLPGRIGSGSIAIQLVTQHALAENMACQMGDPHEMRIHHVMLRITAVKNVLQELPDGFFKLEGSTHAKSLGYTLGNLVKIAREIPGARLERKERRVILQAIEAARTRGGTVALDFGTEKWLETKESERGSGKNK